MGDDDCTGEAAEALGERVDSRGCSAGSGEEREGDTLVVGA